MTNLATLAAKARKPMFRDRDNREFGINKPYLDAALNGNQVFTVNVGADNEPIRIDDGNRLAVIATMRL